MLWFHTYFRSPFFIGVSQKIFSDLFDLFFYELQTEVSQDRGLLKNLNLPLKSLFWGWGGRWNSQVCQKVLLKDYPNSMIQSVFDNSQSFKRFGGGSYGTHCIHKLLYLYNHDRWCVLYLECCNVLLYQPTLRNDWTFHVPCLGRTEVLLVMLLTFLCILELCKRLFSTRSVIVWFSCQ